MMKLTNHFATIKGNVLMVPTLPKVSEAYMLFAQEERHTEISQASNQVETLAFAAEKRHFGGDNWSNNNNKTFKTEQTGFQKTGTTNRYGRSGSSYFCTHCQEQGHSVDRCFKIHGYPPAFKGSRDTKVAALSSSTNSYGEVPRMQQSNANPTITAEQYQQLMAMLAKQQQQTSGSQPNLAMMAGNICLLSQPKYKWLLDSGASDNLCHDLSQFSTYKPVDIYNTYITIPHGSRIPVSHVGSVVLNADIILQNVLYVPNFKYNLISVHKLCQDLKCEILLLMTSVLFVVRKGIQFLLVM